MRPSSTAVCCRRFGGLSSPLLPFTTPSTVDGGVRCIRVRTRRRPYATNAVVLTPSLSTLPSVGGPCFASSFLSLTADFRLFRWSLRRFFVTSPPSATAHRRCVTTLVTTDEPVTVEVPCLLDEEAAVGPPSSGPSSPTADKKDGKGGEPPTLSPTEIEDVLLRPSPYDSSYDWQDWLRNEEYSDAWASSSWAAGNSENGGEWRGVKDLGFAPLDVSTRYLLELLDDTAEGVRRGMDRATTQRCNRAIKRLADNSIGGKKLIGRAQRADAILRRMERCERLHRRHNRVIGDPLRHELPLPDNLTYFSVLRLYAAESGPKELALRAEAVVEEMVEKFDIQSKATVWNQALSCWAVSTEAEKAIHAASLLEKMKESAASGDIAVVSNDGEGKERQPSLTVDSSSYVQVLRACALSVGSYDNQCRKLGAEVAVRVWSDFKKSGLPFTSHAVTFLLKAIGNLPRGDSRGARFIRDAFRRCCEEGLVNAHVMHQLGKTVESMSLDGEQLRGMVGKELARDLENDLPVISLLRKVPKKWTTNASSKNRWGW